MKIFSDRNQRLNFIENEIQKTHIEVATLKAKNVTFEKEIAEKDKQINLMQSQCTYLEKVTENFMLHNIFYKLIF